MIDCITVPLSKTKQLVETVDLYPSLADLAGFLSPSGPQPPDVMSLVPILKNPDIGFRDHACHTYPRKGNQLIGCSIRTERYRMVEWVNVEDQSAGKIYELYDYENDPLEAKNLAESKTEILDELKAILQKHPKVKPQIK